MMRNEVLRLCVWTRLRSRCQSIEAAILDASSGARHDRASPKLAGSERVLALPLKLEEVTQTRGLLADLGAGIADDLERMLRSRAASGAQYVEFELVMEFVDTWLEMVKSKGGA